LRLKNLQNEFLRDLLPLGYKISIALGYREALKREFRSWGITGEKAQKVPVKDFLSKTQKREAPESWIAVSLSKYYPRRFLLKKNL